MRHNLIKLLSSFLVAASLGVAAPACVVRGTGAMWVVDVEPPPPRATATIVARPGFVWIEGNWIWIEGRWTWRDGYWERDRPGHVWVQGAWIHRGGRWHWRDGRWDRGPRQRPAPRPQVRDHRHR